ncbi:MAG: alpha/beta fold hydrolase [Amphiplicatus sp.]
MKLFTEKIAVAPGIALEARRYEGGAKTPVLCLPGLTRNARDFENVAPFIADLGRDVVVLSLRGRGGSDRDPDYLHYVPTTYVDDVLCVMEALGLSSAVFLGTSLGGIVSMLINQAASDRVAAAVINDVGPALAPEGLARIADYAGETRRAANLDEAAAQTRAINEIAFPNRDDAFWRAFAARTCREGEDGWIPDYDPAIGKALVEAGPAPNLWPAFESLKAKPTLVIHGALSDLLTPPIIERMRAANPNIRICDVANTGHAPTLSEPEARMAIEAFLAPLG